MSSSSLYSFMGGWGGSYWGWRGARRGKSGPEQGQRIHSRAFTYYVNGSEKNFEMFRGVAAVKILAVKLSSLLFIRVSVVGLCSIIGMSTSALAGSVEVDVTCETIAIEKAAVESGLPPQATQQLVDSLEGQGNRHIYDPDDPKKLDLTEDKNGVTGFAIAGITQPKHIPGGLDYFEKAWRTEGNLVEQHVTANGHAQEVIRLTPESLRSLPDGTEVVQHTLGPGPDYTKTRIKGRDPLSYDIRGGVTAWAIVRLKKLTNNHLRILNQNPSDPRVLQMIGDLTKNEGAAELYHPDLQVIAKRLDRFSTSTTEYHSVMQLMDYLAEHGEEGALDLIFSHYPKLEFTPIKSNFMLHGHGKPSIMIKPQTLTQLQTIYAYRDFLKARKAAKSTSPSNSTLFDILYRADQPNHFKVFEAFNNVMPHLLNRDAGFTSFQYTELTDIYTSSGAKLTVPEYFMKKEVEALDLDFSLNLFGIWERAGMLKAFELKYGSDESLWKSVLQRLSGNDPHHIYFRARRKPQFPGTYVILRIPKPKGAPGPGLPNPYEGALSFPDGDSGGLQLIEVP